MVVWPLLLCFALCWTGNLFQVQPASHIVTNGEKHQLEQWTIQNWQDTDQFCPYVNSA